jgi:hypothetical protein
MNLWWHRTFSASAMVALMFGVAAATHHGSAAVWDASRPVTVTGTVAEFKFVNPHVLLAIDVRKDDGATERWEGELTNPISLAREVGWTRDTFKPGDRITLAGYPARSGATSMAITRVLSDDVRQRYLAERRGAQ